MTESKYLVIGGGMTGDAACKGIRSVDPQGSIVLVGDDVHPPYARPPLTKGLWQGQDEAKIWRGTAEEGVDLRLGRTIASVDLGARRATDDRGETYDYERVLLATGSNKVGPMLVDRGIRLRRARRLPDALHLLARVAASPLVTDECRYQLALAKLLQDMAKPAVAAITTSSARVMAAVRRSHTIRLVARLLWGQGGLTRG